MVPIQTIYVCEPFNCTKCTFEKNGMIVWQIVSQAQVLCIYMHVLRMRMRQLDSRQTGATLHRAFVPLLLLHIGSLVGWKRKEASTCCMWRNFYSTFTMSEWCLVYSSLVLASLSSGSGALIIDNIRRINVYVVLVSR